jgi:hypothetical protein
MIRYGTFLTPYSDEPTIVRLNDMAFIPTHEGNVDYQAYLVWLEEGNVPEDVNLEAPQ